jgi:hypothetical protein
MQHYFNESAIGSIILMKMPYVAFPNRPPIFYAWISVPSRDNGTLKNGLGPVFLSKEFPNCTSETIKARSFYKTNYISAMRSDPAFIVSDFHWKLSARNSFQFLSASATSAPLTRIQTVETVFGRTTQGLYINLNLNLVKSI